MQRRCCIHASGTHLGVMIGLMCPDLGLPMADLRDVLFFLNTRTATTTTMIMKTTKMDMTTTMVTIFFLSCSFGLVSPDLPASAYGNV